MPGSELNDVINGVFELLGSVLLWLNVRRLFRDRTVLGVSLWPTAFFTAWGCWNLYYYPSLAQIWSALGAGSMVLANAIWLAGAVLFLRNRSLEG